jgi:hypothetical protein
MTSRNLYSRLQRALAVSKSGRDPGAHRFRDKAHYLSIVHLNLAQQRFLFPSSPSLFPSVDRGGCSI